jgi:TonB family protein
VAIVDEGSPPDDDRDDDPRAPDPAISAIIAAIVAARRRLAAATAARTMATAATHALTFAARRKLAIATAQRTIAVIAAQRHLATAAQRKLSTAAAQRRLSVVAAQRRLAVGAVQRRLAVVAAQRRLAAAAGQRRLASAPTRRRRRRDPAPAGRRRRSAFSLAPTPTRRRRRDRAPTRRRRDRAPTRRRRRSATGLIVAPTPTRRRRRRDPAPTGRRRNFAALLLLAFALAVPPRAVAQPNPPAPNSPAPTPNAPTPNAPAPNAPNAQATFEPPHAIGSTDVPYPANAPAHTNPIVVTVKLLVDATGTVQKVELQTSPQPVFDDAVIAAVKQFTFEPARYGGAPVPVEITFTHTFLPPPPPPPPPTDEGPPRTSILRGKIIELGTRVAVGGATVTVVVGDRRYSTDADPKGHFRLELPSGPARIAVIAQAHDPFVQQENLAEHQELAVTYLIARDRYDPYEIVVVGEQRREEVSRITLRGPEIKQVPGTFGDPFRVVQTLPGVASVVSLLPYPIVRGASPSSTGFLIDGTRVPLLYHLLSGPSVIHPEFIDEIQFYPGGAPASYGGYTGGIVDGRTVRARPDEHLLDFDANLLQVGGFVREPVPQLGATLTVAGRYGYPGFLLSLATNQLSLSYWDYQLRLDGGTPRDGWTIFAFGAHDELDTVAPTADPNDPNPPLAPSLILGFHRVDLRYHRTHGKLDELYRVVFGFDKTFSMGTDFWVWSAEPEIALRWKQNDQLTINSGVSGFVHDVGQGSQAVDNGTSNPLSMITAQLDKFYLGSAYAEVLWRPTPDWLIRPGVRADVYADDTTTKPAVDPRLTVRYKLAERDDLPDVQPGSDDSVVWLKGSAGIYHQPPRFVLPLPGLDMMPLKYGLLRSFQTSLGAEIPLRDKLELSAEGFFNYMDPTIFDLSVNAASLGTDANSTLIPTQVVNPPDRGDMIINRLTQPQLGRAYGLEFLLRRQSKSGVFGWVSYTLSRSERYKDGAWAPYDFDRTHLVNLVAGLPLRRNWDVGLRLTYQSGKPVTTTEGYNTARGDGYVRFDLRVDKRAVWQKWLLDFYVDITNIALLPEEVQPGTVIRYVLPTVGLRGRF